MASNKTKKKYICITKIGNNPDGSAECVKYHTSNLLKYSQFLDTKFKNWRYTNIYSNFGFNKGQQLGYFTIHNKPTSATL